MKEITCSYTNKGKIACSKPKGPKFRAKISNRPSYFGIIQMGHIAHTHTTSFCDHTIPWKTTIQTECNSHLKQRLGCGPFFLGKSFKHERCATYYFSYFYGNSSTLNEILPCLYICTRRWRACAWTMCNILFFLLLWAFFNLNEILPCLYIG